MYLPETRIHTDYIPDLGKESFCKPKKIKGLGVLNSIFV